jgi:REP element-mobilizing transposase RayT
MRQNSSKQVKERGGVMESDTDRFEHGDMPSFSNFLPARAEVGATRRYLPHWQLDEGLYFVTWRLADSLPQSLLRQWNEERKHWLRKNPKPWDGQTREAYQKAFPRRLEAWLDAGYGACVLKEPACATILSEVMLRFDGVRYDMASFVLMPNHVHTLFQLRGTTQLDNLLKAWKGASARKINLHLNRRGTLWVDESRDTSIRNPDHLVRSYNYIRNNPEKAGLRKGTYLYYELPGVERQIRGWSGDFDGPRDSDIPV